MRVAGRLCFLGLVWAFEHVSELDAVGGSGSASFLGFFWPVFAGTAMAVVAVKQEAMFSTESTTQSSGIATTLLKHGKNKQLEFIAKIINLFFSNSNTDSDGENWDWRACSRPKII